MCREKLSLGGRLGVEYERGRAQLKTQFAWRAATQSASLTWRTYFTQALGAALFAEAKRVKQVPRQVLTCGLRLLLQNLSRSPGCGTRCPVVQLGGGLCCEDSGKHLRWSDLTGAAFPEEEGGFQ